MNKYTFQTQSNKNFFQTSSSPKQEELSPQSCQRKFNRIEALISGAKADKPDELSSLKAELRKDIDTLSKTALDASQKSFLNKVDTKFKALDSSKKNLETAKSNKNFFETTNSPALVQPKQPQTQKPTIPTTVSQPAIFPKQEELLPIHCRNQWKIIEKELNLGKSTSDINNLIIRLQSDLNTLLTPNSNLSTGERTSLVTIQEKLARALAKAVTPAPMPVSQPTKVAHQNQSFSPISGLTNLLQDIGKGSAADYSKYEKDLGIFIDLLNQSEIAFSAGELATLESQIAHAQGKIISYVRNELNHGRSINYDGLYNSLETLKSRVVARNDPSKSPRDYRRVYSANNAHPLPAILLTTATRPVAKKAPGSAFKIESLADVDTFIASLPKPLTEGDLITNRKKLSAAFQFIETLTHAIKVKDQTISKEEIFALEIQIENTRAPISQICQILEPLRKKLSAPIGNLDDVFGKKIKEISATVGAINSLNQLDIQLTKLNTELQALKEPLEHLNELEQLIAFLSTGNNLTSDTELENNLHRINARENAIRYLVKQCEKNVVDPRIKLSPKQESELIQLRKKVSTIKVSINSLRTNHRDNLVKTIEIEKNNLKKAGKKIDDDNYENYSQNLQLRIGTMASTLELLELLEKLDKEMNRIQPKK